MALDLISAETLVRFIDNALSYGAHLSDPRLSGWVQTLDELRANIRKNLAGGRVDLTVAEAQKEANAKDQLHDRRHRKLNRLLTAYAEDERPQIAQAAELMLGLLYAEGLAFINKPFEVELAYNEKFDERLKRPDVQAAVVTLSTPLPELPADVRGIAVAAGELHDALRKVRDARLDKLGAPESPELFEARNEGLELWATFARVVEKVHKGQAPAKRQAREALIGDWKRLVAVTADDSDNTSTQPTPAPDTPDATPGATPA